jgi:membrane protease YdiL (CAAX protease family)
MDIEPRAGEQDSGLPDRGVLRNEIWLVLALSLLSSAVYSLVSLLEAPIRGRTVGLFGDVGLVRQLLPIVFDLVPVALVVHLLHRSGETAGDIGLDRDAPARDAARGFALATLVGLSGLLLYVVAVKAGLNRGVLPAPPGGHWWTIPVLLLSSVRAAVLEEVIVVGYLLRRLDQLGWRKNTALAASAVLRGSYHLYQGFGGFAGNVVMGLVFGRIYQRTGRTVPLVVAHFLIDAAAGAGWLLLHGHVSWLPA